MSARDRPEPDWWVVGLDEIKRSLEGLETWEVREICRSAGGRPVWACTRGPKRQLRRSANFSAAYGAGHLPAFQGEEAGPPCFMYLAGMHGAEMEPPAAAVNFMHAVERGSDLDGQGWPKIAAAAGGMRLVVVPVANPDGRARVEPRSLVGLTLADLRYWGQGRWKSGEDIGYPDCKRHKPLPLDRVEFPGGYPNDDGYNLMHDVTPGDLRTAEARAILELAVEETPGCIINAHSYELAPGVIGRSNLLPGWAERQRELSASIERALHGRALRPAAYYESPGYDLNVALHFACGALAVTFEGPHGLDSNPYTHREILDCHLSAIEGALEFGARSGFRPPTPGRV